MHLLKYLKVSYGSAPTGVWAGAGPGTAHHTTPHRTTRHGHIDQPNRAGFTELKLMLPGKKKKRKKSSSLCSEIHVTFTPSLLLTLSRLCDRVNRPGFFLVANRPSQLHSTSRQANSYYSLVPQTIITTSASSNNSDICPGSSDSDLIRRLNVVRLAI